MPHEGPHERKRPTDEEPAYGVCIHMLIETIGILAKKTYI